MSEPEVSAAPDAVRWPQELSGLVEQLIADSTLGPCTIALLANQHTRDVTAMVRAGNVPGAALVELCGICCGGAATTAAADELLIILSWRPGSGGVPDDGDRGWWQAMLDRTAGSPVHLVDWLLVDEPAAVSLSTLFGR